MPRPLAGRQTGFTLIELMVSIAIGLVVLLALTVLLSRNSGNQSELDRTTRQLENTRFALDTLSEDLQHAGYYGEFNPNLLSANYAIPDPCETDVASLQWNTATATPTIPPAVTGHSAAQAAVLGCLDNHLAGTEAVTIRRVDTNGTGTLLADVEKTNLYIQVGRCADDLLQIAAGSEAANFVLRDRACAAAVPSVRRYVSRTYYVASCNDCAANDGIPTLKRVEMIDGELRTTALAEGIEDLQLEFGVDPPAAAGSLPDGRPDRFILADAMPAPDAGDPLQDKWEYVVATRIHLLGRGTQRSSGFTDTRTYNLGPNKPALAPAEPAFKRTLMTGTVRLNNVGGRRDL